MRKSSRLRVRRITVSARGTSVRAATITPATTTAALPSASANPAAPPLARPARNGSTNMIGTTHRSWKISMPVASRPCGASISPRSVRILSTIAVLDSPTRQPRNSATCQGGPTTNAAAAVTATVSPICTKPPSTTCRPIVRSRPNENSMPIVKSSRMTPISASSSTRCTSPTSRSAFGPTRTPATMNPGSAGSLRRWNRRMTTSETAKMMARSSRTASWLTCPASAGEVGQS